LNPSFIALGSGIENIDKIAGSNNCKIIATLWFISPYFNEFDPNV
jgi:hypothetical protein